MAYRDLQEFISFLEQKKELKRISVPVDWNLEITEITDRVSKAHGPALFFENVKGSPYPVVTNAFGSYKRMAYALGVEDLEDISKEIAGLLDLSKFSGLGNVVKSMPQYAKLAYIFPKTVAKGACQEVKENDPDLNTLPILKCWPEDGGRYITLPLVITRDPDTGTQNVGMYRLQVFDKNTTGMHWHLHKDGRSIFEKYRANGERMPISVAIGTDPATTYAATAPMPSFINEFLLAGYLRKKSLPLVRSINSEILVPADAEFILEGYVDPNEPLRKEGPFGDHTGYYSLADEYPVFHVTTITHKKKPVYPATVVGQPPMEDCFLGKATERIFLPILKTQFPEIVDLNFPLEGVFHNCVIISIDKRYPGHAKKIMHSVWGMGQLMYTKLVIVVDKDIDPQNISMVAWKAFNNIDAGRDVVIVEGPLDALDHSSPLPHYGHKMGIDATRKWKEEGHTREWPKDIAMAPETIAKVTERWKNYGLDV